MTEELYWGHLLPETRKLLTLEKEKKISYLRKNLGAKVVTGTRPGIYCPTLTHARIEEALQAMFLLAKEGTGTGFAIWGPPGVGKSELIRKFIYDLTRNGLCLKNEIFWFSAPQTSGEKRFLENFLRAVGERNINKRDDTETMLVRLMEKLVSMGVKMVFLDEIHFLLAGETLTQETLNVIKRLHNDLPITIVLVGTKRLLDVLEADDADEMSGRFPAVGIQSWKRSDAEDEDSDYVQVLAQVEMRLPLPARSELARKYKMVILEFSKGSPREAYALIREATVAAINDKSPRIEPKHFEVARSSPLLAYQHGENDDKKNQKKNYEKK